MTRAAPHHDVHSRLPALRPSRRPSTRPSRNFGEANGQWQIAQLRAYWELPAMVPQFLRSGPRGLSPAPWLSRGLLVNQGLRGTAGFMTCFRRAGARHKKLVRTFAATSRATTSPPLWVRCHLMPQ